MTDENDILLNGINNDINNKSNNFNNRRSILICIAYAVGLGTPTICWLLALFNVAIHTDKIATGAVCLSVYAPLLAFINNKNEKRSLRVQLAHFAWLWFVSNTGYQLFWELPWFIIKHRLMYGGINNEDDMRWYYPWWAYGNADTRYISMIDPGIVIGITGMDAAIALVEVLMCILYYKGYRVLWSYFDLTVGTSLCWGQFVWYLGVIYRNFEQIQDGNFGLYVKFGILNIPWCIFGFISVAGNIWNLAYIYKQKIIQDYVQKGQDVNEEESFWQASHLFLKVGENGLIQNHKYMNMDENKNDVTLKYLLIFMFLWPWIFLICDISIYYHLYFS